MQSKWLIRTTHNKILGPISKQKLVSFIEKGSLTQNDEVSSGNGYWFYLKEEELVDRFLFTEEEQGFNPISECKTVLCLSQKEKEDEEDFSDTDTNNTLVIGQDLLSQLNDSPESAPEPQMVSDDGQLLPSDDDLAFPDMGDEDEIDIPIEDDVPSVHSAENRLGVEPEVDMHEGVGFQGKLPSDDDLAFPDMGDDEDQRSDEDELDISLETKAPPVPPKKKVIEIKKPEISRGAVGHSDNQHEKVVKGKSDYYLFYIFFIMVGLVAYAVYFYYSKISQGKQSIYTDELGALFIPTVYAQTVDSKKNSYFDSIVTSYGKIDFRFNVAGAKLTVLGIDFPTDCKIKDEFSFLLLYMLTSDVERKRVDEQLSGCKIPLSHRALTLYQTFKLTPELREKSITSILSGVSEYDRKVISNVMNNHKKFRLERTFILAFNELVESFDKKLSKGQRFRLREKIQKMTVSENSDSILNYFLEVLLALDVDNQAWAKRVLTQLLKKDFTRIMFNINRNFFKDNDEYFTFSENIHRAIAIIVEKFEHKMLGLLAINYFATFDQSDDTNRQLQDLGTLWSLSQVRGLVDQSIYGEHFFLPWYYILKNKAIELELDSYVKKYLTPEMIKKLGPDVIPVYLAHFPKGEESRKAFLDVIQSSFNKKDYYTQFVLIQALKRESIRKGLPRIPNKFKGAAFQLERELYHRALESGGLTNLAVLKLAELGEKDISFLWWLIL